MVTCSAWNITSNQITLNMQFKPTSLSLSRSPSSSLAEGDVVTLNCNTTTSHPVVESITWSGDVASRGNESSSVVPGEYGGQRRISYLTFEVNRADNEGAVTCSALDVTSYPVIMDVNFKPLRNTLTVSPSTGVVSEDQTVTITCGASASYPNTTMIWSPGLNVIQDTYTNGQNGGQSLSSSRSIRASRSHNQEIIECTPTWQGQIQNDLRKTVQLEVTFRPLNNRLTVSPSTSVSEDQTVTITCIASESSPRTTMAWTSGLTVLQDTYANGQNGGELFTSSRSIRARRTHNQQSIACTPTWQGQTDGALRKTIQLEVTFLTSSLALTVSPSGSLALNATATLTCVTSSSNPVVSSVTWSDGLDTRGSVSSTVSSGSYNGQELHTTLRFQITREDNGRRVTCSAQGKTSPQRTLSVVYTPMFITANNFIFKSTLNTNTSMIVRFASSPAPSHVTWRGQRIVYTPTGSLDEYEVTWFIDKVQIDDFRDYTVEVVNNEGTSRIVVQLTNAAPPESVSSKQSSSAGAIAGGVVSVLVVGCLVAAAVVLYFVYFKKRWNQNGDNSSSKCISLKRKHHQSDKSEYYNVGDTADPAIAKDPAHVKLGDSSNPYVSEVGSKEDGGDTNHYANLPKIVHPAQVKLGENSTLYVTGDGGNVGGGHVGGGDNADGGGAYVNLTQATDPDHVNIYHTSNPNHSGETAYVNLREVGANKETDGHKPYQALQHVDTTLTPTYANMGVAMDGSSGTRDEHDEANNPTYEPVGAGNNAKTKPRVANKPKTGDKPPKTPPAKPGMAPIMAQLTTEIEANQQEQKHNGKRPPITPRKPQINTEKKQPSENAQGKTKKFWRKSKTPPGVDKSEDVVIDTPYEDVSQFNKLSVKDVSKMYEKK